MRLTSMRPYFHSLLNYGSLGIPSIVFVVLLLSGVECPDAADCQRGWGSLGLGWSSHKLIVFQVMFQQLNLLVAVCIAKLSFLILRVDAMLLKDECRD